MYDDHRMLPHFNETRDKKIIFQHLLNSELDNIFNNATFLSATEIHFNCCCDDIMIRPTKFFGGSARAAPPASNFEYGKIL